jgi:hypothetical protein
MAPVSTSAAAVRIVLPWLEQTWGRLMRTYVAFREAMAGCPEVCQLKRKPWRLLVPANTIHNPVCRPAWVHLHRRHMLPGRQGSLWTQKFDPQVGASVFCQ